MFTIQLKLLNHIYTADYRPIHTSGFLKIYYQTCTVSLW